MYLSSGGKTADGWRDVTAHVTRFADTGEVWIERTSRSYLYIIAHNERGWGMSQRGLSVMCRANETAACACWMDKLANANSYICSEKMLDSFQG